MFLLSNQINTRTAPQERTPVAEGQNWTRYGIPAGADIKYLYINVSRYILVTLLSEREGEILRYPATGSKFRSGGAGVHPPTQAKD